MNYGEHGQPNPIFGPEGADFLRLDAVSCASLPAYFRGLDHRLTRSGPVAAALNWAAVLMEPYDAALERSDPKKLSANSFLRGSAVALQVASKLLPVSAMMHIGELEDVPTVDDDSDVVTRYNVFSEHIAHLSEQGYWMASAYHGLLDEWMDELNPHISQQTNTRLGFGFVFYLVHDYLERSARDDMATMEALLDEGEIDWDDEFAELDLGE